MITHRPCGVCGSLVSAVTGCRHWKPDGSVLSARKKAERERNKQKHLNAVAQARRDVQRFIIETGREYR